MLNFSSDLINIIGSNEIESFHKTLNEMLVSSNYSSAQQLDNNLNSLLGVNGNSFLQIPIPTTSSMNKQRSFLTSSQQLDSFLYDSSLFQSNGGVQDYDLKCTNTDEVSKAFCEISRENKEFQPQPRYNDFSNINISPFSIDNSKLEELKSDTSVLDPILSLPYNSLPNSYFTNMDKDLIKQETHSGPMRNSFNLAKEKEEDAPTLVSLTRDQLNTFTSTEMEEYQKLNSGIRNLSSQEKKELKRQKRLIKNRESAHLSRQRKRERLTDLEHRVEELSHNSVTLSKTLNGLENDNLVLKAEVTQMIEIIKDSPVLAALFCTVASNTNKHERMVGHESLPSLPLLLYTSKFPGSSPCQRLDFQVLFHQPIYSFSNSTERLLIGVNVSLT
eukprot:gene12035-14077_t